jgi:hypothetical protein
MNGPDFYTATAQLVPLLLLAILFQLRYATAFAHKLMEADGKIALLILGLGGRTERSNGTGSDSEEFTKQEREAALTLAQARTLSLTSQEFLAAAERARNETWLQEIDHYQHVKRRATLWVLAPVSLGFLSMITSLVAVTFNRPPSWLAVFVWPGIAALVVLFFVSLAGMLADQATKANEAAEDHLLQVGMDVNRGLFVFVETPGLDPEENQQLQRRRAEEDKARSRTLRKHLSDTQ